MVGYGESVLSLVHRMRDGFVVTSHGESVEIIKELDYS